MSRHAGDVACELARVVDALNGWSWPNVVSTLAATLVGAFVALLGTALLAHRRLAKEKRWDVVGEYVYPSTSAASKNAVRPEYNRLIADFATGTFDVLLCYDLNRLTRQPRQLEDWIDAAEDKGLRIVTSNGEAALATDKGRTFARIRAVVGKSRRRGGESTAEAERPGSPRGRPIPWRERPLRLPPRGREARRHRARGRSDPGGCPSTARRGHPLRRLQGLE